MTWTISGRSRFAGRTWVRWWASTQNGLRCISAANCSPKIWINRIPGSSRTFGWFERIADRGDRNGRRSSRQLDRDLVVETFAKQAASQRRVHAHVAAVHVEFVRANDAMPAQVAGRGFNLHPCPKKDALGVAAARIGQRIDDHHAFEPLAQEAHTAVDFVQAL